MKAAWIGVVGVTVAVLGGCMMGPDYRRPDLPVPETYRFLPEDASLQALDSRWWEDFGDPVLNGMVEEAIANNRDLRAALANSEKAAALMRELYSPFARNRDKIIVMGVRSAEMTKYAANCMLATKISFINEIATICERVGADVRDVRAGIGSDSRIGYQFIYPGVGYGGSCFPKDVKALIRTAENAGVRPELLNAVEAVNARQKKLMASRVEDYFAPQGGVAGKTLAMWGLAFKANTDDMREAAAITIINELTSKGMKVRAFDPVAADNARSIFADNKLVEIVDDQYAACQGAQGLMVVTEWNQFRNPDFTRVRSLLTAPLLFDGRNLYSPTSMADHGFAYFCIGRANA